MSREILKLIAAETFGESYQAHKIELDLELDTASRIDNQSTILENPKLGETAKIKSYRSLEKLAGRISQNSAQILTYFLDGSRHVYKIDDIAYSHGNSRKMVYPIVAGQVTVGCCRRVNKKMFSEKFLGEIVLALPDVANFDNSRGFIVNLARKLNDTMISKKLPIRISKILEYSTSRLANEKFEDRAISRVQDYMYQAEQDMVDRLKKLW